MTPASAVPAIVRLETVDSTQSVAFALGARGAADRTVVVADHQSAGRGRRGHTWEAPAGTSLLASILVRPRLSLALLPTLSPTTSVVVAEALRRVAGVAARVKWPNDVVVAGRKIAGILLESRVGSGVSGPGRASLRPPAVGAGLEPPATTEPGRVSVRPPSAQAGLTAPVTVVIGVGINLAQREFPAELAGRATSVALETGHAADRETTLGALLDVFDTWRARLEEEGFHPVRARWLALSDTIGRTVSVDGVTGVAVDLDVDGALLVDDGTEVRRVVAGEIAPGDAAPDARALMPQDGGAAAGTPVRG